MWMYMLCLWCATLVADSDSSQVITAARDLYQRPHGLDQLRYMLVLQTDCNQTAPRTAHSFTDLTTRTTPRQSVTTPRQSVRSNVSQDRPGEDQVADIRDFPYVASVQLNRAMFLQTPFIMGPVQKLLNNSACTKLRFNGSWYFVCGGSLVSRNKVLTAAHCILGVPRRSLFRVIVGSNFYNEQPNDQIIDVIQIYLHPGFDITRLGGRRGLFAHDLAVMRLAWPVTLSASVQPLQLADPATNLVGRRCSLAGYGISNPNNPAPSRLQSAQLTVVSRHQCQKIVDSSSLIKQKVYIRDLHLCTTDAGNVPCMGDSGSALVCDGRAFGVYSFGDTSCDAGGHLPRGFMSVQYYLPFLRYALWL